MILPEILLRSAAGSQEGAALTVLPIARTCYLSESRNLPMELGSEQTCDFSELIKLRGTFSLDHGSHL